MTVKDLLASPTKELREFAAIAPKQSSLSCSTVRKDFACDDGCLCVTSHCGEPVQYYPEMAPKPPPCPGKP